MLWSRLTAWFVPAVVFVGTSALTVAIVVLPDFGLGVLAALVGARILMGLGRLLIMFRMAGSWFHKHSSPRIAGAV